MTQPEPPQFGIPDCTCIPFTRQSGPPRYCQPGDTVDMIRGWEIGRDCPHHRRARTTPDNPAASGDAADNLLATPAELERRQRYAWSHAGLCPMCSHEDGKGRLCDACEADVRKMRPAYRRRPWEKFRQLSTGTPIQSSGYTPAELLGGGDESPVATPRNTPDPHSPDSSTGPGALAGLLARTLADHGISQADLARRARLSTKHVNQICKGNARISIDAAVRLEFVLGVPAAEWMRADAAGQIAVHRDAALLSMVTAELQQLREAADTELPDRAQAAIRALEQQVVVRDERLAAVREYVRTSDDDGIRTRETVLRILRAGGEVGP